MVYIFDTKFNENLKVVFGLKKVFGLGLHTTKNICGYLGINEELLFKDLDQDKLRKLVQLIIDKKIKLNLDLKREIKDNLFNKVQLRTFQGVRHIYGLPVNGQRSKTNGRTAKRSWSRKLVNDM